MSSYPARTPRSRLVFRVLFDQLWRRNITATQFSVLSKYPDPRVTPFKKNLTSPQVTHRDCCPSSCGVLLPFIPADPEDTNNPTTAGYHALQQAMVKPPPRTMRPYIRVFTHTTYVPPFHARFGQNSLTRFTRGYNRLPSLERICEQPDSEE